MRYEFLTGVRLNDEGGPEWSRGDVVELDQDTAAVLLAQRLVREADEDDE